MELREEAEQSAQCLWCHAQLRIGDSLALCVCLLPPRANGLYEVVFIFPPFFEEDRFEVVIDA